MHKFAIGSGKLGSRWLVTIVSWARASHGMVHDQLQIMNANLSRKNDMA